MAASLSTKEAAELLGVTPQHLRRMIESGQLLAERVGHHYVVDAASLETLRAARTAGASIPSLPPGTLAQLAQARTMLAQIPWDAIRHAQEVLRQFEESGLADAMRAAQQAEAAMAHTPTPLPPRPTWQQWAGSDNPHDAIEKLRARARARANGAIGGNSTDILRAMRDGRHQHE